MARGVDRGQFQSERWWWHGQLSEGHGCPTQRRALDALDAWDMTRLAEFMADMMPTILVISGITNIILYLILYNNYILPTILYWYNGIYIILVY